MTKSDDMTKLRHMLDATEKALYYTQNRSRGDLDSDELLCLALVRLLEIIGEAAKGVSSETREANTSIPWRQIAGTRDRLIHGYFDVDYDIVWVIVTSDLPGLVTKLHNILCSDE